MMMRLSSILFIVHFLCVTMTVARGISLSKPGCPQKCGNLTVPYPFGIGMDCSANIDLTIICNNTLNPPKPILMVMSLEVLEINLDNNIVRVLHDVSPLINCSTERKSTQLGKPIVGIPFTFSSVYNRMVVVGCNNVVSMVPSNGAMGGGCNPICGEMGGGCTGINCCQTTIPPRLQEIEIFYSTPQANGDATCGYAFMADQMWLANDFINSSFRTYNSSSNSVDTSSKYVSIAFEWEFDTSNIMTLQGVKCETSLQYSPSLDANGSNSMNITRCYCDSGFEGNPYLPGGGCQDIDECSNTTCINGTCINTVGSFTCQVLNVIEEHPQSKRPTIIGISSGIGALLLLIVAWMSTKVIRKRIKANRKAKFFKRNGGLLLEQQQSSNDGGAQKINFFNSKELAQATDRYNENRILGRGGQGTVYKGMLTDGRIVAVKKSKKLDEADVEVFVNEVVILSQISHRNIVKLLGCCLETEVPLLVYEFIPNGTLFQHIHDQNDGFPLSWKMRLRIAIEVAGALSYLHYAASVPIYHRDIKSSNILLDDKYRAKVSDFGTSRSIAIDQTHLTTRVLGTFGYLDPEYFQSSQFTEKSDVYSFGVVMVELLTGEKAISAVRADAGKSLATHFLHSMEQNHLFDIIAPKVIEDGRTEEIVAVAKLARRCLNLDSKRRPTMKEVAMELEGIQMMKEGSVLQSNLEEIEFHSIDLSEVHDFPSSLDNTNLNVITAESSESPLLFGNS